MYHILDRSLCSIDGLLHIQHGNVAIFQHRVATSQFYEPASPARPREGGMQQGRTVNMMKRYEKCSIKHMGLSENRVYSQ